MNDRQSDKPSVPPKKTNPHDGHRARLRARFRESGLTGFATHEILELLLTYCIPRVNVNETAHALLDRFGSLSDVLDASPEELCTVLGVGPEAATFLRLVPEIYRACELERSEPDAPLDTIQKLERYFRALYVGVANERVYLLLLNNSLRAIDCVMLGEGTVNSAPVTVRRLVELAFHHRASCVVLAHNHPHGIAVPSGDDITVTENLLRTLDTMSIPLLEHFIVADHSCAAILRKRRQAMTVAPVIGRDPVQFCSTFYGESDFDRETE